MHWRGLSRQQADRVEQRTRQLFEPLARIPGLSLLEFDPGLELRAGRNKGGAVEAILAESPADAPSPSSATTSVTKPPSASSSASAPAASPPSSAANGAKPPPNSGSSPPPN